MWHYSNAKRVVRFAGRKSGFSGFTRFLRFFKGGLPMQTSNANAFLEREPLGKLMRKFSIPCIISLLTGALYNIVDQIYIANADYLGSYGNAANTVVFPMTVVALAIAVMIDVNFNTVQVRIFFNTYKALSADIISR
jgi:hypothetical protein